MSYIALYRKYRPNRFEEVAGQKHIVKTLENAVRQNRIAHAYLFCGPRGTGKTTIAKIFAKMVNCESNDHIPCEQCDNCLASSQGNHPDIIEIDAASNNGVDEVRDLIEKVKYAPLRGKYKVYIIDEVHMMSTGAFNALLKTIEEPPAHVIFIFATTEPQKVIPTIISRCQRYDFTKVGMQDMMPRLQTILEKEKIEYEREAIRLVCQLADGGMRDALSIVDQVIAYSQNIVSVEAVNAIYGIMSVEEKIELLELVADMRTAECIQRVQVFISRGIDIKRCTLDLIEILKETVIYDYSNDISLLTILNKEEVYRAKVNKTTKERLKMIDELMNTYEKYRFASNVNSYFEVCLLNMMSIQDETNEVIINKNVPRETSITPSIDNTTVQSMKIKTESMGELPLEEDKDNIIFEEKPIGKKKEIKSTLPFKESLGLEDEFILSLLVGANKIDKNQDILQLKKLPQYYLNPDWARYANLLREFNLVASSPEYIVVSVQNQAIANEINEQDAQGSFIDFMNIILLKKKKVFAITEEQQKKVINEFVHRQKEGTLPRAAEIQVETDSLELVKKLFGENVEIKE